MPSVNLSLSPDVQALPRGVQTALKKLVSASTQPVGLTIDPVAGSVAMLSGSFRAGDAGTPPADVARRFLTENRAAFKLPSGLKGLEQLPPEPVGEAHQVRFQLLVSGVSVFGAGVVVTVGPVGFVELVCANLPTVGRIATKPKISAEQALTAARKAWAIEGDAKLEPTLVVFDKSSLLHQSGGAEPAWHFGLQTPEGTQHLLISATNGTPVFNGFVPGEAGGTPATIVTCPTDPFPQYHVNPATGVPDFVRFGPTGLSLPESASGSPAQVALGFFSRYPLVFGTGDVPQQLQIKTIEQDTAPPHMTHVVLQQIYAGVPVFGCELRVHISPSLTVTSISGNYLRDPQVVPEASVAEGAARATAITTLAQVIFDWLGIDTNGNGRFPLHGRLPDRRVREILRDLQMRTQALGLKILPGVLSQLPGSTNELTYHYRMPYADLFVGAVRNEVVFAVQHLQSADRDVFDAMTANEISIPTLVEHDGNVVVSPLNADAALTDAILLRTLGFYAGLGRTSYDNLNSPAEAVTNSALVFGGCPNAHWDAFRNQMWFCLGMIAGDVVAHEFTHGVTQATARLIYLDEPGALNEHYSDVMGACCFPDTTPGSWLIGESTVLPTPRDMKSPTVGTYSAYMQRGPGCTGVLSPLTNPSCDAGNVHTNSGIGNRAAVLLSDGDGTAAHPGIGRDRLARLFLDTLTMRMHPWSRYLDEVHNTWETASDFAARGVTVVNSANPSGPQLPFTGVRDEVSWAFTQVGVDSRLIGGWFTVPGGLTGGSFTETWYAGETMPPSETVADVELIVRAVLPNGTPYWEGRSLLSAGGAVTFPGGVFGASILSAGVGTPSKTVVVRIFHSGFLPLQVAVNIVPSSPTPLPTRTEFTTPTTAHWAFGVGGKGDDTINAGKTIGGAGCVIDQVDLELLDANGNVVGTTRRGSPDAVVHFGLFGSLSWGARITSDGTGGTDETVGVHWWFDVGVANRYRLRYYLLGTGCSLT